MTIEVSKKHKGLFYIGESVVILDQNHFVAQPRLNEAQESLFRRFCANMNLIK